MLLGDRMTFLKKANQKYLFYGFIALFLIGCANPVWWYRSPTSDYTHFDFDPTELNCIELTEQVIRVSAIISTPHVLLIGLHIAVIFIRSFCLVYIAGCLDNLFAKYKHLSMSSKIWV